jgi:hypothetical protein
LAQRSRKRGRRAKLAARPTEPRPRRATAEERNAAVRAALEPLQEGERPWPAIVSAVVAGALVVANLVLLVGNIKLRGTKPGGEIAYVIVMAMCAYGLWRLRYWAVLGFMVLLLLTILEFALLLIRASNVAGFALAIVVVAGGGYLFYKLVRVLSRVQMPRPPGR